LKNTKLQVRGRNYDRRKGVIFMTEAKNYQEKYWNLMTEIKFQAIYLRKYLYRLEDLNKYIEMFLAIISTGSLGGLIFYREFSTIWLLIIVTSQVISAIKPFFKHPKWIKIIYDMINKLDYLFIKAENYWFIVSEGKISVEEIHSLIINISKKRLNFETLYFRDTIIPQKKRVVLYANRNTLKYFNTHYLKEV
jgi:hypothetical protein